MAVWCVTARWGVFTPTRWNQQISKDRAKCLNTFGGNADFDQRRKIKPVQTVFTLIVILLSHCHEITLKKGKRLRKCHYLISCRDEKIDTTHDSMVNMKSLA